MNTFEPFQHDCSSVLCLWRSDSVRCFYLLVSAGETSIVHLTAGLRSLPLTYSCQSIGCRRRPARNSFSSCLGLTDCYCNFSVMAFIRKVWVCLIPDAHPKPHKSLMYSFIYGSPCLFVQASCQLRPKSYPLRSHFWSPNCPYSCVCAQIVCVSACIVWGWYWMPWILNKEMNTHLPHRHTHTHIGAVFLPLTYPEDTSEVKLLSMGLFSAANKTRRKTQSYSRYSIPLTAPFLWCFSSDLALFTVCVCVSAYPFALVASRVCNKERGPGCKSSPLLDLFCSAVLTLWEREQ